MERFYDQLTSKEKEEARKLSVWLIWYEDRFGWGDDRDPAVPIDAFLSEEEATKYVLDHEGFIDTQSGKFDGLFIDPSLLSELLYLILIPLERARSLMKEAKENNIL